MNGEKNKCLVIGAAGGIGRSLVARLAHEGWQLILAGRNESTLMETAQTVGDNLTDISVADAHNFDQVDSIFSQYPGITGAVNLAGSILLKPAHATSTEDFDQTIDQNIRTAFSLVRAAGKNMRKAGGSVVLMSSCAAQIGLPNHETISAAKAAVEGLTRSAAATYAPNDLRFNAVAPGLTKTPLSERLTSNEASRKASLAMHPLGRLGRPDDVASAIAFLLEPANTWITGQVFGIDGGVSQVKGR